MSGEEIIEEIKRERIRNYFIGFPYWTILAIIIGIIALVIVVGIILIIAGIIGIVLYTRKRKPTDQQIDEWLYEDIEKLKKRSSEKLGLDKIDPKEIIADALAITGPILWSVSGVDKKDFVFKKGKDEFVRFGIYNVAILQLTKKFIGTYKCTYNFLKNIPLNESTDEYFYKDIVTISTSEISTSYELPNRQKIVHAEAFAMKIPSGDAVQVILWAPILEKITGGKPKQLPTTEAEKAITAIRTQLRDKK